MQRLPYFHQPRLGDSMRTLSRCELISALQEVKMLGLSDIVANMIQELRVTELNFSKQYRMLITVQTFIGKYFQY